MTIEILDDDEVEPTPTMIGRCQVRLGGGCGRAVFSDDPEAIELGHDFRGEKYGIICAVCLAALFNTRSWSGGPGHEAQREAGRNAKSHSPGIRLPGSPPPRQGPKGPMGGRPRKKL